MRLTEPAVRAAMQAHARSFGSTWRVADHVECWRRADGAFAGGSNADFEWLYEELRRRWQVFRAPAGDHWTAREAFERLRALDGVCASARLSEFGDAHLPDCWRALEAVAPIKRTKSPSVVAISKFLHFRNPRLFVIVDDAVMWRRVLAPAWLKERVAYERERIRALLPDAVCPPSESCDLLSYLAVLRWSAGVARRNPAIGRCFAEYVRADPSGSASRLPFEAYEAAAVEWLLLGMAELPPPGVEPVPPGDGGRATP